MLTPRAPTHCGDTLLHWGAKTYVMGILNVTPDSFSGDGVGNDLGGAIARAEQFVRDGADIVDVGGESTRPGAAFVPEEEERARVVPVIRALATRLAVPISVDTSRASVAAAALAAGATMVNDVWALHRDPALADVVARSGAALVLMHNRAATATVDALGGHYDDVQYADVVADVIAWLRESIAVAIAAGIPRAQLIADPGIGFGKTVAQNLTLMRRLPELGTLGIPMLAGTSRKSFIGLTLDLPVEDRLEGTAATVAVAIAGGVDIVRVHDVCAMARVARMTDAIIPEQASDFVAVNLAARLATRMLHRVDIRVRVTTLHGGKEVIHRLTLEGAVEICCGDRAGGENATDRAGALVAVELHDDWAIDPNATDMNMRRDGIVDRVDPERITHALPVTIDMVGRPAIRSCIRERHFFAR